MCVRACVCVRARAYMYTYHIRTIHSLVRSVAAGLVLDIGDCMMSENDPAVLAAPPSTTLPNTDLQSVSNTYSTYKKLPIT